MVVGLPVSAGSAAPSVEGQVEALQSLQPRLEAIGLAATLQRCAVPVLNIEVHTHIYSGQSALMLGGSRSRAPPVTKPVRVV